MNAAFLAFSASMSVFLVFWGITRSGLVAISKRFDFPEDQDWAPGADAPMIMRLLGSAARRANHETGLRALVEKVPDARLANLEATIIQAGTPWGITPRGLITTQIVGAVLGTVGGVYLMLLLDLWWVFGLGCGVVLGLAPQSTINSMARKRVAYIRKTLPSMLDLLVVNAESGRSIREGFDLVGQKLDGPLAEELRFVSRMLQVGASEEQAFLMLAERTGLPEMQDLASSIVTSIRYGGIDIRSALRLLARQVRERWRQEIELRINRLTVKLVFPIFVCLFPSFLILMVGPALISFGERL